MYCLGLRPLSCGSERCGGATCQWALSRNLFITQHVPRIADRPQQRPLEIGIDLLPQLADVDVDHVRLRVEMIVPDILEQHRAGNDLAGVSHEVLQELDLPGLQRYAALTAH